MTEGPEITLSALILSGVHPGRSQNAGDVIPDKRFPGPNSRAEAPHSLAMAPIGLSYPSAHRHCFQLPAAGMPPALKVQQKAAGPHPGILADVWAAVPANLRERETSVTCLRHTAKFSCKLLKVP